MTHSPYRIKPGKKVRLKNYPTDATWPFKDKSEAMPLIEKNLKQLAELQELLYAESKRSLLIVLQAMDAGGKDGAISHVFSGVNPQGCQVTSFKVPTARERAQDFLWRHHIVCPQHGMIGIFNRSHYEAVLVERVHHIVPKSTWSKRYEQINDFESLLAADNTIILKFFLHISKDEQKRRFEARLRDKDRHWKFSPADLHEREFWDDYVSAFEDALERCSTKESPWYVVPSDHKWFRNWMISDTIVRTLKAQRMKFPKAAPGLSHVKVV